MNKDKKILIIGPDSPHVENFIQRLDTEGITIKVISSGDRFITHSDNQIINFSLVRLLNWFQTTSTIKRIASDFEPDLVWMHQANSFSFFPTLALRKRFPLVITVWGSDILIAPKKLFLIRKMVQFILKNVKAITADARFLGEQTLKLCGQVNKPSLHICQFGMTPLDVSLDKENLIYSNRGHKPLYRIAAIIKGFHRFKQDDSQNWKLIIAGEGEDTPRLKKMVIDLGLSDSVSFVGFLSAKENAEWYGKSKYFISVPESDGTAVSLLEAMYYGCFPIVSDLPANREWIKHKENGYIVTDLDQNYIQESMLVDIDQAARINRKQVKESATPEASRQKFISVIEEVCHKNL